MFERVLFVSHMRPDYMPPAQFGKRQIIAGQQCPTVRGPDGDLVSLRLPGGGYDLPKELAAAGLADWPDLLIVVGDCGNASRPGNLGAMACRRLFWAADSHYYANPIQHIVSYARSEPFDAFAVVHNPAHAHWYVEAGLGPVAVIINPSARIWPNLPQRRRLPRIAFVGHTHRMHPRRKSLLERMIRLGLPVAVETLSPDMAAARYASAQITFNCSMNGDFNMRIFEVLGAGGFLITDRLCEQSGLLTLFKDGEDLVTYADEAELIQLVRRYLADPEACLRIAEHGHRTYMDRYAPDQQVARLLDFARTGEPPDYPQDLRATAAPGFGERLGERMAVYGMVQELARNTALLQVAAEPAVGARMISDWVDLPTIRVDLVGDGGTEPEFRAQLAALGVDAQVHTDGDPAKADILFLKAGTDPVPHLGRMPRLQIVMFTEAEADQVAAAIPAMAEYGLDPIGPTSSIFRHRKSSIRLETR